MISKLIKIVATGAILGVCLFNAPHAQAERMSGMTIGVAGDIAFAINENQDFVIAPIAKINGDTDVNTVAGFAGSIFDTNFKHAFGGNISFGYLMANGLSGDVELGYRVIKNTDKVISANFIESKIFTGMVNANYFADFGTIISPYITAGVGFARTDASGLFVDGIDTETSANTANEVGFSNLKAIRLAYQAGAGLTGKVADNALIGVGYKFFGVASIDSQDNDFTDLTVVTQSVNGVNTVTGNSPIPLASVNSNLLKFGTLNNNIHTVTVFAKFVM